jgi:hypothetical protein
MSGARQCDGRSETIRPRTNDNCIISIRHQF